MAVSWDSWHFLLNNVLFSHTCISVFAHLPFLKQHIRAPPCKKKTKWICPWESELGPKYWKVSQLTPQISVYLSQYIYQEAPPLFLTLWEWLWIIINQQTTRKLSDLVAKRHPYSLLLSKPRSPSLSSSMQQNNK